MTIMWLQRGGGRGRERGRERRRGGIRGCYMASLNRNLEVVKNWNDEGCCLS